MTAFCKVEADLRADGQVIKTKTWPSCDVMKTGPTRGWLTRQFNIALKSAKADVVIRGEWVARYNEDHGHMSVSGWLSGVNNRLLVKRGIFED